MGTSGGKYRNLLDCYPPTNDGLLMKPAYEELDRARGDEERVPFHPGLTRNQSKGFPVKPRYGAVEKKGR